MSTSDIASKKKLDLFCINMTTPMQLMMYIGNDLIEAIQLEATRIQRPGYLGQFKRNLKLKYRDLIRQDPNNNPEFLVINSEKQNQPFADK